MACICYKRHWRFIFLVILKSYSNNVKSKRKRQTRRKIKFYKSNCALWIFFFILGIFSVKEKKCIQQQSQFLWAKISEFELNIKWWANGWNKCYRRWCLFGAAGVVTKSKTEKKLSWHFTEIEDDFARDFVVVLVVIA